MKKILYIIPILLLSILLIKNVYGYSIGSGTAVTISDVSDGVSYMNDFPFDSYSTIYDNVYNGDYNFIFNSDLFKEGLNKHNYYLILYNKVIFYDTEFTCEAVLSDYRLSGSSNICSLGLYPQLSGTVEYFTFNANFNKIVSTTLESCTYNSNSSTVAASFVYSNVQYYTEEYILSRIYSNFDVKYTNGNSIIKRNPEFSFVPTYSENYETCNLKLDIKNPPDYYKLEYAINTSNSTWYYFDNINGLTISDNCLVIVRMLDENGDEIFANSCNVTMLGNELSSTYFGVNFDNSQKQLLAFTPILYNNMHENFDIYFSYTSVSIDENSSGKTAFKDNNGFTIWNNYTNKSEEYMLINSHTYYMTSASAEVTLNFKIVNKNTSIVALSRSFVFNLSTGISKPVSSTTNGEDDGIFNSGAGSNINDNLFASDSLEIDWSLDNSKNTIKTFFESTLSFFNLILSFLVLMPAWITVPLNTLFILTIVVFVFHVIRG